MSSIPQIAYDLDLIVATTQVAYKVNAPVINAIPILTGFGADKVLEEIAEALKA